VANFTIQIGQFIIKNIVRNVWLENFYILVRVITIVIGNVKLVLRNNIAAQVAILEDI